MYNWTHVVEGDGGVESSPHQIDNETYEAAEFHRELGASMGQYIAFQLFRILLPLMVFIFCFWCHDNARRGRDRDREREGQMTTGVGAGGGMEMTEAQEANRKSVLAETLVFKGVVEADEENPAPNESIDGECSVVKGDIYIPKSSATEATTTSSYSTQLMEDPFADEERPTCSICMVEYEAGETVCWSPNPDCTHAFHWECMAQWLLKHDECPQCRNNYLQKSPAALAENLEGGENVEGGVGTEDAMARHHDDVLTASSTFSSSTPPGSAPSSPREGGDETLSSPSRNVGSSVASALAVDSTTTGIVPDPALGRITGRSSGIGGSVRGNHGSVIVGVRQEARESWSDVNMGIVGRHGGGRSSGGATSGRSTSTRTSRPGVPPPPLPSRGTFSRPATVTPPVRTPPVEVGGRCADDGSYGDRL